ncbi:MAG: HEAT repeat domain-containing protein, partial [Acidobacteria bacterium]|nr:HEAT repeat domain-containing protein [Acidobacteriota bacterium]
SHCHRTSLSTLVSMWDFHHRLLDAARAQGAQVDGVFSQLERVYASTDPKGVEILARWLQPGSPDHVRAAAAAALSRIHTPSAVMVLGPALRDPDFQVRWRAIGGLANFANNIPIGGVGPSADPWPFRTDDTMRYLVNSEEIRDKEDFYLDFWRAWWSENQGAVQALADGAAE